MEIKYQQNNNSSGRNKKGNDTNGKVSIDNLAFL